MKSKSLFTKLVAFMLCVIMAISCLPVSAFAAENDWETPIDPAGPGFTAENPMFLEWTWDEDQTFGTASVTVPKGMTMYFAVYGLSTANVLLANGENVEFTPGMGRMMPGTFELTAGADASVEYNLVLTYFEGSFQNPKQAQLGDNKATVAEGNTDGFVFEYIADEDGELAVSISSTDGNWFYVVNNLTTGAYGDNHWSDDSPVVNPETVTVTAGDKIQIIVNTYNATGINPADDNLIVNLAYAGCAHNYEMTVVPPTKEADGYVVYTCSACGDSYQGDVAIPGGSTKALRFAGKSLSLESDLTVVFWMDDDVVKAGYTDISAKFEIGGKETVLELPETVSSGYYKVYFAGVAPKQVNEDIKITITAMYQGIQVVTEDTYTVLTYCTNTLPKSSTKDSLRRVIVDLLYYCAAQQVYGKYNTENLCTDIFADEKYAQYDFCKTEGNPTVTSIQNKNHVVIDNPTATVPGASLVLNTAVEYKVYTTLPSNVELSTITVKFVTESGMEFEVNGEDMVLSGSYYTTNFTKMAAKQMREEIYITIYCDGVAISNTMLTSVESYVAKNLGKYGDDLDNLMNRMICYGDSAAAYFSN